MKRFINRLLIFGAIMMLSGTLFSQGKVRGNYAGEAYAGGIVYVDSTGYTRVDSVGRADSLRQISRSAILGYKEYVALLSQSDTFPPVATVLYNDLGGAVTWTRDAPGDYDAESDSLFTVGKTLLTIDGGIIYEDAGSPNPLSVTLAIDNITVFDVLTGNEMNLWSGLYQGRLIVRIRVYN